MILKNIKILKIQIQYHPKLWIDLIYFLKLIIVLNNWQICYKMRCKNKIKIKIKLKIKLKLKLKCYLIYFI